MGICEALLKGQHTHCPATHTDTCTCFNLHAQFDIVCVCAGLRQAMGTFGALMGSLIAGLAYTLSGRNYTVTFSLSAIPALGALLLVSTVWSVELVDQDS